MGHYKINATVVIGLTRHVNPIDPPISDTNNTLLNFSKTRDTFDIIKRIPNNNNKKKPRLFLHIAILAPYGNSNDCCRNDKHRGDWEREREKFLKAALNRISPFYYPITVAPAGDGQAMIALSWVLHEFSIAYGVDDVVLF